MKDKTSVLRSIVCSNLLLLIIMNMCIVHSKQEGFNNIFGYICACASYLLGFCIFALVFEHVSSERMVILDRILFIGSTIGLLYWGVNVFMQEIDIFPNTAASYTRHLMPWPIYCVCLIMTVSIVWYLLLENYSASRGCTKWIRKIVALGAIVLQISLMYAPNVFYDLGGSIFHVHAYTNSIINVLQFQPYDEYNVSIYGHYGLFFILPVKILEWLGNSQLYSIILVIALIGGITFLLEYYLLDKLVTSDILYIVLVVANTIISTQIYGSGQYYQLLPHRIFFPILILTFCWWLIQGKKVGIWGWIVCTFSIVWNVEVGIVCSIVWFVTCIYTQIINGQYDFQQKTKYVIGNVGCVIIFTFLAYVIVGIYNIICGGNFNALDVFIYPIGSTVYEIEALALEWPSIFSGYVLVILLLLSVLCYYFHLFKVRKLDVKESFIVLDTIMALGLLVYFMNRAAYCNLSIVHIQFIILLGFLGERCIRRYPKKEHMIFSIQNFVSCKILIAHAVVILLSSMCLASVGNMENAIMSRVNSVYNIEITEAVYTQIEQEVPENVKAFGLGVPEIYSKLGRDTHIHMIDWSDINPINMEYVSNIIEDEDIVFANKSSFELLGCYEDFVCEKEYIIIGQVYGLYKRK